MKQYNYSVIIPHYNSPKLLQRCLASIPEREDIQVIIVDDCSDPQKVDFDHLPGRERSYTEIYRTAQGGSAGGARNVGLAHAKGEWLLFADADDFYTSQAWALFDKNLSSGADIIYFGITSVDTDTMVPTNRYKTYDQFVQAYASDKTEENAQRLRYRHDVPWGKMIRHSLVRDNNIIFGETRYCNDTLFSCRCALSAKYVSVEPQAAYCVTDTQNSLTKQLSPEAASIRFQVLCEKNQMLIDHHITDYPTPFIFYLRQVLTSSPRYFCKMLVTAMHFPQPVLLDIKRWLNT